MKFSRYHNILISIFGIIILFLVIKNHVQSFQQESFYTQRFNLEKTETIRVIGEVEVLKFSTEELIIQQSNGLKELLTPHHYYAFEIEGKEYTFTFEYLVEEEEQLILRYLVWLYTKPPVYTAKVSIREVQVDENPSKASIILHLITDDFGCCLLEGKKLRYQWTKRNPKLGFVGSSRDVFGYNYSPYSSLEGELKEDFPFNEFHSDYTLLWLGRANLTKPTADLLAVIEAINAKVLVAQPNTKLYVITPAPSPVAYFDAKIDTITNALQQRYAQNLIDVNTLVKQQPDWQTRLFYKDYGLNEKAYELILNYLDEQLF